ncbi:MAG: FG-GAP repeat protein, partial [Phycisphaerales bacterium JB061]
MQSHQSRPLVFAGLIVAATLSSPAYSQLCDPLEVANLIAADTKERDQLGGSVSVSGNTAVVG